MDTATFGCRGTRLCARSIQLAPVWLGGWKRASHPDLQRFELPRVQTSLSFLRFWSLHRRWQKSDFSCLNGVASYWRSSRSSGCKTTSWTASEPMLLTPSPRRCYLRVRASKRVLNLSHPQSSALERSESDAIELLTQAWFRVAELVRSQSNREQRAPSVQQNRHPSHSQASSTRPVLSDYVRMSVIRNSRDRHAWPAGLPPRLLL